MRYYETAQTLEAKTMEELEAVRGIGPALVAKLRPLVVLGTGKTKGGKAARK